MRSPLKWGQKICEIALELQFHEIFLKLSMNIVGNRDQAETIESGPLCISDLFKNKSVAYFLFIQQGLEILGPEKKHVAQNRTS